MFGAGLRGGELPVSERTPLEFYLITKYHSVFDEGLRRGRKIDFSQTRFEVI